MVEVETEEEIIDILDDVVMTYSNSVMFARIARIRFEITE